jgi:flagellar protein FlgJ
MTKITLTTTLLLFLAAQSVVIGKQPNRVSKARKTTHEHIKATPPTGADSKAKALRGRRLVTFPSGASLPVAKNQAKKEHRDPNSSGNPLLVTSGKYRDVKISKNFTAGEYARSGSTAFDFARIDLKHLKCLQRLRDSVGRPVLISSGYRSFTYNQIIYRQRGEKPTRSQHISGTATDTKIPGMSGLEVAKAAIDACGPSISIGLGRKYAHIDGRGHFKSWKYADVNNRQLAELRQYREASKMAQERRARRVIDGSVSKRRGVRGSKPLPKTD